MFVFSLTEKSLSLMYLGQWNGYVDFYVYMCFFAGYIIYSAKTTASVMFKLKQKINDKH